MINQGWRWITGHEGRYLWTRDESGRVRVGRLDEVKRAGLRSSEQIVELTPRHRGRFKRSFILSHGDTQSRRWICEDEILINFLSGSSGSDPVMTHGGKVEGVEVAVRCVDGGRVGLTGDVVVVRK
jgi:hypothetical protein